MNSATHTAMPASPWHVLVCRKIPSPTWLSRTGSIASAAAGPSVIVCSRSTKFDVDLLMASDDMLWIASSMDGTVEVMQRLPAKRENFMKKKIFLRRFMRKQRWILRHVHQAVMLKRVSRISFRKIFLSLKRFPNCSHSCGRLWWCTEVKLRWARKLRPSITEGLIEEDFNCISGGEDLS